MKLTIINGGSYKPGDRVSLVEVERPVCGWWHDCRSEGVKVKILLDHGTQVDLSGVGQKQPEIVSIGERHRGIDSNKQGSW